MNSKRGYTSTTPLIIGAAAGTLAAALLLPGRTPAIPCRFRTQYSIASLEKIRIGGTDQWILVRSENIAMNPVLLLLHGGPGTSELTFLRRHTRELERYFTVVNWDQRGAGKSYRAGRDASAMTIERMVEDTRELTEYLLKRFDQKKIILQGRSWGSALGLLTVARYPKLFHAYVGIGQISDVNQSEKMSYNWTLLQAEKRKDRNALRELLLMGPPPYSGNWLKKFNTQRKYVAKYGGEMLGNSLGGNGSMVRSIILSPEYTLNDQLHYNKSAQRSLKLIQPRLMEVNLFNTIPKTDVPVFLAEGRHDRVVPSELSASYFDFLEAPQKSLTWFEQSAHMPDIEEQEKFQQLLVRQVRPFAVS